MTGQIVTCLEAQFDGSDCHLSWRHIVTGQIVTCLEAQCDGSNWHLSRKHIVTGHIDDDTLKSGTPECVQNSI